MKKTKLLCCAFAAAALCGFADEDYVRHVVTLTGSVGEGHTFPGASYPFGMIQPGPDSGTAIWCSGYQNTDKTIRGISQTHLNGTGCPSMGDILLMPYTGVTDGVDYSSPYSGQQCAPDRYAVTFDRFGVKAAATCSEHVSWLTFDYGKTATKKMFVDCASTLLQTWRAKFGQVIPESDYALSEDRTEISGTRLVQAWPTYRLFYVVKFDRPWSSIARQPSNVFEGAGDRFDLVFEGGAPVVGARVALSTVSVEGARRNLAAESEGMDFDKVAAANRRAWNELLSRAVIEEGTDGQKANWYTSLYHLFIQPNNIADVDGQYRGADDRVNRAPGGRYYSTLSLWDTFRAAHPLYTILTPERVDGFIETMALHNEAHGHLPVWLLWGRETHDMIGVHSIPVIVDAWAKGFRPVEGRRLLAAMVKSMTANDAEWNDLAWNITWENGYIPYKPGTFDRFHRPDGNVSRTLEHAYDWWCIAHMAELLGDERSRRDAVKWSETWKNIIDPSVGFARPRAPRTAGGAFLENFDPRNSSAPGAWWSDYTEANSWIYTWHVFQDPDGLVERMGGREKALAKLDEFFSLPTGRNDDPPGQIGQYWHGNEPSHHIVYFYSLLGRPDKAARLIRRVCSEEYRPVPDGLCGNDDCGQMSAWYLFSAMGFYPFNPCDDGYVMGEPQVARARVKLPGGKTLTVRLGERGAPARLNGAEIKGERLTHAQILAGGELVIPRRD